MKSILSELGLAFNADEYTQQYTNEVFLKLLKRYTVRTIDRTTKIPQITKLYNLVKAGNTKIIELPRFTFHQLVSSTCSKNSPITTVDIDLPKHKSIDTLDYVGKSNPNQQIVVKHIVENVFGSNDGVSGVTLKLLAGLGKSYCAMDIISKMKMKTLIVVPNTYLLDQWVNLLKEYFPQTTIGTLYGKQKLDGDIIVGIINTVSELKSFPHTEKKPLPNVGLKVKYTKAIREIQVDDILKTVGLTIFDESHMYVSKEFRKVFRRIWSRYTLGLSATPDIREDKLDIIHQMWLGPILDAEKLDGFNTAQDSFQSDVKMIEYHALNEHAKFSIREDGMIDYSTIVAAIISDPNRNKIIIDEIVKLMQQDRYVFVFSDRRSHLESLYQLLEQKCIDIEIASQLELPESEKKIILYGGSSEETIGKAKTLSTVVFTTYAYSSTGVSITRLNSLVLTTPRRSNMKQIINRVFRLGSDQSIKRIIVDIVDAKFPIKQQVRERIKAYKERGSVIVKSKVHV